MRRLVCAGLLPLLLLSLCGAAAAKEYPPKVQVYSREPGLFGLNNTLICHVSGFHPPEISIELLKNEEVIPGSQQTDLAFEQTWQYHLTTHVSFKPTKGDKFSCRVTHLKETKTYIWDADM